MKNYTFLYWVLLFLIVLFIIFLIKNTGDNLKDKNNYVDKDESNSSIKTKIRVNTEKNIPIESNSPNKVSSKGVTEKPIKMKQNNDDKNIKNRASAPMIASAQVPDAFINNNNLPEHPSLNNNDSLLGIDINSNEIRDDLERVIAYENRDIPEMVNLYNAASIMANRDLYKFQYGQMEDEALEESDNNITDFIACHQYFTEKYNIENNLLHRYASFQYNTIERNEAEGIIGSKSSNYIVNKINDNVDNNLDIEAYHPPEIITDMFCNDFINRFTNKQN